MHVIINTANLVNVSVAISDTAAKRVRMSFNPSTLPNVDRLKALAAAFISECDRIAIEMTADESKSDHQVIKEIVLREMATAKTKIQSASHFAVGAVTARL